jgi:CHAT domain-containing protein/tetratricopeptide (TPR) repeat protein
MRATSALGYASAVLLALSVPGFLAGVAPPALPPYLRVLRGAEAKRAAHLERVFAQRYSAGRYARAAEAVREMAQLRGRAQGEGHWQVADARRLVRSLERLARLSQDEREAFVGMGKLRRQAAQLTNQGRYSQAQSLFERALAGCRKVLGERHPLTANYYNNLAGNLDDQGKYTQAQPLYAKALDIYRKVLGEQHPHTATGYNNVGLNLAVQGKYAQAQRFYAKALAINRKVWGEQHPETASTYANLGGTLRDLGNYAQAQPLMEKALAIRHKVFGEQHLDTANSYNNLAGNLSSQGKYAQAQRLFEKALAIFRLLLGEEHPLSAAVYNNLASDLASQGKSAQAQALHEKALAIRRKVLGERHPDTANSYEQVASCLNAQGKYVQAQPLFEKALAISRKILGEEHPATADGYNNLAANLDDQGKHAQAQPLYEKALAINRKVHGEEHPDTATGANNLAYNLNAQGKHAQAQALFEKALAIRRKVLGERHPSTADSYHNLAYILHARGEYARAEKQAEHSFAGYESARLHVSFSGLGRADFASRRSPQTLLAVLRARHGKPVLAWEALERSLARALLDDLAPRNHFSADERNRLQALKARVALLDRQLSVLLASSRDHPRKQARLLRAQRDGAQRSLNDFRFALEKKHGPAAGKVYSLAGIQKQMGEQDALVAWVDLDRIAEHWACLLRRRGQPVWVRLPGSGPKHAWTAPDIALAARLRQALRLPALTKEWQTLAARLHKQRLAPLVKHLERAGVRRLIVLPSPALVGIPIEAVLAARPRPASDYTVSYAPSCTLFAYLQQRARVKADKAPRLLAVGDPAFRQRGQPARLPEPPDHGVLLTGVRRGGAAARAGLKSGDVLLRYAGTRLSDLAALAAALKKHAADRPGDKPGLEIAYWRAGKMGTAKLFPGPLGVSVDRRSAALALRTEWETQRLLAATREGFLPLPGTRREVQALATLFATGETLLDGSACEENLEALARKDKLKAYRYLHFATHGHADAQAPLRSFLALADRDLPDPVRQVLAGKPAHLGRLTAGHILENWRLDADLVVLSACQSGLGRYEKGEGYVGFAQALFLAGARALVLSQWSVDDEATALLMVRFYQNLLGKRKGLKKALGKAEALREAREWLRTLSRKEARSAVASLPRGKVAPRKRGAKGSKPFAHPYYWAGFILVGDPH